jgi:putative SOS response-associated peptidase YedK
MTSEAGGKQPYYITATDGPILTIAGLWSEWRDRVNDETLVTCTMNRHQFRGANIYRADRVLFSESRNC